MEKLMKLLISHDL